MLEQDQITVIGILPGQNRVPGENAGDRAASVGPAVEVSEDRAGPLKFDEFKDFLPTGLRFQPLVEMTRFSCRA